MEKTERQNELFVTCSTGLEPLLAAELGQLGFSEAVAGYRGVYVVVSDLDAVYKINYCSRFASRVLLPLVRFKCYDSKTLYKYADSIDWTSFIPQGKTFAIDANVSHKMLRNSLFAAQVVKDAICDQFRVKTGKRPNVDVKSPDIQLNLFIHDTKAVISFDTSGAPLYKRGYRQESVEAPIQESLAAAILRLGGYRGDEVLFDPCCGSGTFLIEAALMASKTPPGYLRKDWGFYYLPQFSQKEWLRVKAEADRERIPLPSGLISGVDINKNAVRVAKINLRAAGFHQSVDVDYGDFREYTPEPPPNFIVANPPHGVRLDDVSQLAPLYRSLGDFMKRKAAKPAKGLVFTSSSDLAKEVGLAASRRHVLSSGGLEARLLEFELY